MATYFHCLFFLSILLCSDISPSADAKAKPSHPKTLVLPVSKDKCTKQHTIQINQRTPSVPVKLTVDLGEKYLWANCEEGFVSSSYKPALCKSPLCEFLNEHYCGADLEPIDICKSRVGKPGCYNNACSKLIENRVVSIATGGEVGQDIISVQSHNKKHPSKIFSLPNFTFICGRNWLLDNLADGVTGIAGLGRDNLSLPYSLSKAIGFPNKFSICLSSSAKSNGQIFFGHGPATETDYLIHTPLIVNPMDEYGSRESADYFIGVKSIRVEGEEIIFNKKLLSINKKTGAGGTMISTVQPYTILHTSIYRPLLKAFNSKATNYESKKYSPKPVPFTTCFAANGNDIEHDSANMPAIELELESEKGGKVFWRISGANLMISISSYTMCFAFIDGGTHVKTPIVIGGHQIENNLLQFDLVNSKLGFSSNLQARNTSCSQL